MSKNVYPKARPGTSLWWIGLWATIWWAVSLLWVAWLFWLAKGFYAGDWSSALDQAYHSSVLPLMLGLILLVWLIGGIIWLRQLKRQRIGYGTAFKDLFLTIRR